LKKSSKSVSIENMLDIDNSIALSELQIKLTKLQTVKKFFDLSKIKERADKSRVYIYVNRKMISANSKNELIDVLYNYIQEHKSETLTMQDLFLPCLEYKRDVQKRSAKTIKEYVLRWKSLSTMPITHKNLCELDVFDWIDALQEYISIKNMTHSCFRDFRSVLIAIYDYAIIKKHIKTNPLIELKPGMLVFASESDEDDTIVNMILSRTQMLDLQNLALKNMNDMFSLAIVFQLNSALRIGEIKALRQQDIFEDFIRVKGQVVDNQTSILNDDGNIIFLPTKDIHLNHVKGRKKQGYRNVPLSSTAKAVIKKAIELNPTGEYIFMPNSKTLKTVTYNRHIKKLCEQMNFTNYHNISSHDLRFSFASYLHKSGTDISTIQYLLGHTTRAMTMKYLKLNIEEENLSCEFARLLG